jgi:tetratricopeptide (TPR) repeat protein
MQNMSSWLVPTLLLFAPPQAQPAPRQTVPKVEELPPEEDKAAKPKEYSFNPLQAETEMNTGRYYFKRGKYHAAAERFREATRWNPTLAEAYERLGAAEEKQHDLKAAHEAYARYLEMAPDAKDAKEIKKKLSKM